MLFKYIGGSSGIEALQTMKSFCEQHTLMAGNPTKFNDPFEFKIDVDFKANDETISKRWLLNHPSASELEYQEWRQGRHTDQGLRPVIEEFRRKLLSQFGVFCLSAVDDNHLMWSHYAAAHQGVCVGFDEKQLENINGVVGHDFVQYRRTAPRFRYYVEPLNAVDKKVFACKSSLWAYEREYRFIFNRIGKFNFPCTAVKQIILGCRAYPEIQAYAREHCEGGGLDFFQMCDDIHAYCLKKQSVMANRVRVSDSQSLNAGAKGG